MKTILKNKICFEFLSARCNNKWRIPCGFQLLIIVHKFKRKLHLRCYVSEFKPCMTFDMGRSRNPLQ